MRPIRSFAAALLTGGLVGCAPYYSASSADASDHFDGTRFFNPAEAGNRSWSDFWRWQLTREQGPWPERVANPSNATPAVRVDGKSMVVTMVGHASVLIQTDGLNILTDPIWSERASPVSFAGPKRVRPPGIPFEKLPKIDVVLVSHNHYDHMDLPTLRMLWQRDRPKMIVPLGNDTILRDAIDGIEATALDWQEGVAVGNQTRVIAMPVQHWSQRGPFDRNKALWAGFLIETPGGAVFFAGDTGYGDWWVDELKARAPNIRLVLLPVGAFLPRWFMGIAHATPAEAVKIFQRLGAERALGIHWGTFPMADDGYDDAPRELDAARAAAGVSGETFRTLEPSQVWRLD